MLDRNEVQNIDRDKKIGSSFMEKPEPDFLVQNLELCTNLLSSKVLHYKPISVLV